MGNHQAGQNMVAVTLALYNVRKETGQTAQQILDIACNPWNNCDAEFDDEMLPDHTFGQIIKEAFAPDLEYDPNQDQDGEQWYDQVCRPFRTQYQFW